MNLNELTAQEVQEIARANPNNHNLYFYPSPSYPTGLIVVKYNEEHNLYNTTQYQAQTQTGSSLSVSLEALPAHFTYKLGNNPHALHWPNAVITINDEVIFSPEKTTADSDEAPQVKPIGNFWIVSGYIGAYWTEEDAQRALGLIKANMPLYDYATRHEGANGLTTRTEISRQEAEEIAALMGNTLEDLHKYGRIRYQLDAVLYATEIEAPQVLIVKGETERGVVELDGEEDAKEIIDLVNLLAKQMSLNEYTVEIGPRAEIDSEIEIAIAKAR